MSYGKEGGDTMLYVLLIISGLVSWLALKNKAFLLGFLAGASWFVVLAYVAAYPPGSLTAGDTIHNMLLLVLGGVAISMPLVTFRMAKTKEYHLSAGGEEGEPMQHVATISDRRASRHGWGGNFAENPEEYQARVRKILRPSRRRR